MTELDDDLGRIADWRARLAALVDACDMVHVDRVHDAVKARFEPDGTLVDLHIDPDALNSYTNIQLQQIIADVLRMTRVRVYRLVHAHAQKWFSWGVGTNRYGLASDAADGRRADGYETRLDQSGPLWCELEASANQVFAWLAAADCNPVKDLAADISETRTYAESSRDGALTLALDHTGVALWCRLEPEVNEWAAEELADRTLYLYTLALMRARCGERSRIAKRFGPELAAEIFSTAPAAYPDKQTVKRYRQQHLDL